MQCFGHIVNLGTIAILRPISTKAKTMDTYEAITYSLYTNTKDLSYKNGIYLYYIINTTLTITLTSHRGLAGGAITTSY